MWFAHLNGNGAGVVPRAQDCVGHERPAVLHLRVAEPSRAIEVHRYPEGKGTG